MKFFTSNIFKDKYSFIILLAFFTFLLSQHSMVYYYHDDWGVSVLDYVSVQTGFEGQNFTITHLFNFISEFYLNWSGRIGGVFSLIVSERLGLTFIQIFQPVVIMTILISSILISKKISRTDYGVFVVSLSVLLYMSFPSSILVGGIYWYSASTMYMWGIPFFLLAIYLMTVNEKLTIS